MATVIFVQELIKNPRAIHVLVHHQRLESGDCLCGKDLRWGDSHAEHVLEELAEALEDYQSPAPAIKPTQHCTSTACPFTHAHTARWCGYRQPRRCGCPYCYPER